MPIVFQNRLGDSESDRKLRKIYRLHHTLWTIYYSILLGVGGLVVASVLGANMGLFPGLFVLALTIVFLILMIRRRHYF